MKKPVKTEVVAVRLDRETKERAEERASDEDRPLSSWVARRIGQEVAGAPAGNEPASARRHDRLALHLRKDRWPV